ncbi:MAG: hypothetical protein KKG76_09740 [Euryarchaeota archaeon]|nr:hypothetical protein [Euryarchaeota archaeon]
MELTILNWNIGGAKYLEETEDKREITRDLLNNELKRLIERYDHPHVVTLQEIVRYGETKETAINLIDDIVGYSYYPFTLIDTELLSAKDKWNKVKRSGDWPLDHYFAQGNAMLFRDDMPHFHFWDLLCSSSFNWDGVSEDDSGVLLNLLKNAFGNDLMSNVYLFNWDEIPENPIENQRLVEFLIQNCNVTWAKECKIEKSNDGNNISISNGKYLFNWDEIPDNPIEKKRLIEFLIQNCNVNWAKQKKIKKINDNAIVIWDEKCSFKEDSVDGTETKFHTDVFGKRVDKDGKNISSIKEKTIEILLDEKKENAILKISDARIYDLEAKNENGKLNIYTKGTKFTFLEINKEADELTVKRDNGKENKYEKLRILNNGKRITIYTKKKCVNITRNGKKVTLKINDDEPIVLKVKEEKGKLNTYIPGGVSHVEQVYLRSGLYFGNRDTEPRAALVAHFIFNPERKEKKPLDIFVVNLHLTTLTGEREGIPIKDHEASRIRQNQLDVIFLDIVSQYNIWRQKHYPERDNKRQPADGETIEREEPLWILAGDFNFTPESKEYEYIKKEMNFMDVVPIKGSGTKAKGVGNPATLTLDYIFVGPKFISLDHRITEDGIRNNSVDSHAKGSDHFPIYARIPLALPEKK